MEAALSATTIVCPGCQAPQETPAESPGTAPLVIPCQQCRASLVLIQRPIPDAITPTRTCPRKAYTAKSGVSPRTQRSAVIAIATLAFLAYLAFGMTIYGTSYGIKQLDPYQVSESFARQHPVLKTSIGEPMTFGWFPSVQMSRTERTRHADVDFSLTGPRGTGQAALSLEKTDKEWRIREARYQLDGADLQPLWIQFPGDVELLDQLEAMQVELDRAANDQDIEMMMKYLAPDVKVRIISDIPPNHTVRTFNSREAFRQEVLAGILMTKVVRYQRQETDFRLSADGRGATGTILSAEEVTVQGQPVTFIIREAITYSLTGNRPSITSIDAVQQLKQPSS